MKVHMVYNAVQCCAVCCVVMQWKAPLQFLEDDMNRDVDQAPLAPPQIYEMHNLRTFITLDDLLAECKKRHRLNDAECWMPVYRLCRDAVLLLLPGAQFLFCLIFQYFYQS